MFTKDKEIARGGYRVTKKVTDWDAVWGTVFLVGLGILALRVVFG